MKQRRPSVRKIGDLEARIRDIVTEAGYQRFSKRAWYRICAALDNLGDTVLALQSFERFGFGKQFPTQYLRLFGFLQALYLQQDSIVTLHRELVGSWHKQAPTSAWNQLRELRNRIGGHPAERVGAIARITIKSELFKITYWNDRRDGPEYEDVDLPAVYETYKSEVVRILAILEEAIRHKWGEA